LISKRKIDVINDFSLILCQLKEEITPEFFNIVQSKLFLLRFNILIDSQPYIFFLFNDSFLISRINTEKKYEVFRQFDYFNANLYFNESFNFILQSHQSHKFTLVKQEENDELFHLFRSISIEYQSKKKKLDVYLASAFFINLNFIVLILKKSKINFSERKENMKIN
jgi:hypothetical protein